MKCLVISPGKGIVRISRFTSEQFAVEKTRSAGFEAVKETRQCTVMDDLHRRTIAPLELSAALRARLPSVLHDSING
jgi:hypothetical protein